MTYFDLLDTYTKSYIINNVDSYSLIYYLNKDNNKVVEYDKSKNKVKVALKYNLSDKLNELYNNNIEIGNLVLKYTTVRYDFSKFLLKYGIKYNNMKLADKYINDDEEVNIYHILELYIKYGKDDLILGNLPIFEQIINCPSIMLKLIKYKMNKLFIDIFNIIFKDFTLPDFNNEFLVTATKNDNKEMIEFFLDKEIDKEIATVYFIIFRNSEYINKIGNTSNNVNLTLEEWNDIIIHLNIENPELIKFILIKAVKESNVDLIEKLIVNGKIFKSHALIESIKYNKNLIDKYKDNIKYNHNIILAEAISEENIELINEFMEVDIDNWKIYLCRAIITQNTKLIKLFLIGDIIDKEVIEVCIATQNKEIVKMILNSIIEQD